MFILSLMFWALYSSCDGLVGFQSHFLPFYLGLSEVLKGHEKSLQQGYTASAWYGSTFSFLQLFGRFNIFKYLKSNPKGLHDIQIQSIDKENPGALSNTFLLLNSLSQGPTVSTRTSAEGCHPRSWYKKARCPPKPHFTEKYFSAKPLKSC